MDELRQLPLGAEVLVVDLFGSRGIMHLGLREIASCLGSKPDTKTKWPQGGPDVIIGGSPAAGP
jgi:hypothetical protein